MSATDSSQQSHPDGRRVLAVMNAVMLLLSVSLIVWISYDTFTKVAFLDNRHYMKFQFFVCIVFIIDFFVEMHYAQNKGSYFRKRRLFLLLTIPYLNIIDVTGIQLSPNALYFVRFIPLARGALALSIVMGYLSSNAIASLFMSYLSIMILVGYFCSLIFYQFETSVNPAVSTYWDALWWTAMNMVTVGCNIQPVTPTGKIIAVLMPVTGMVLFPLLTVYLSDYVTRAVKHIRSDN